MSPFVLTGLTASTTYLLRVRALNNNRRGPLSTEVSATTSSSTPAATVPAAPSGVSATGGTKQVTVSWNAAATATSYNLYWATTSGVTVATGTKVAAVTSPFLQLGLVDSTAYFYVVTAVNAAGESLASTQTTATTTAAIDGAALYTQNCSGCHGALGTSDKQGASAALITTGIASVSAMATRFNATMGTAIRLTPAQIATISAALQ